MCTEGREHWCCLINALGQDGMFPWQHSQHSTRMIPQHLSVLREIVRCATVRQQMDARLLIQSDGSVSQLLKECRAWGSPGQGNSRTWNGSFSQILSAHWSRRSLHYRSSSCCRTGGLIHLLSDVFKAQFHILPAVSKHVNCLIKTHRREYSVATKPTPTKKGKLKFPWKHCLVPSFFVV